MGQPSGSEIHRNKRPRKMYSDRKARTFFDHNLYPKGRITLCKKTCKKAKKNFSKFAIFLQPPSLRGVVRVVLNFLCYVLCEIILKESDRTVNGYHFHCTIFTQKINQVVKKMGGSVIRV